MAGTELAAVHRQRLPEVWRSTGWPCRDPIEPDLMAAGLPQRQRDDQGRETLRVTGAGIDLLAATRQRNQAVLGTHEALVQRVAVQMQRPARRGSGAVRVADCRPSDFEVARPAPRRAMRPPFSVWMVLAAAVAESPEPQSKSRLGGGEPISD